MVRSAKDSQAEIDPLFVVLGKWLHLQEFKNTSELTYPVGVTSVMCWCFPFDCAGVRIPGQARVWCRENAYVFNVENCENYESCLSR